VRVSSPFMNNPGQVITDIERRLEWYKVPLYCFGRAGGLSRPDSSSLGFFPWLRYRQIDQRFDIGKPAAGRVPDPNVDTKASHGS